MKNITITLDERTAAWIRVYAAQQGKSVSRVVGDVLAERMRDTHDYNEAMRVFFARRPCKFEFVDGRRPTRDEIHDRPDLR